MIIIYTIISFALGCQVYYNKDLLFDFSALKGLAIPYGDEGKSLYINTCALLNQQCVKNTRLLEESNSTIDTTSSTNTTITTDNETVSTTTTANETVVSTEVDTNTTNNQVDTNTTLDTNTIDNQTTDSNTTTNTNESVIENNDDDDDDDKYKLKEDENNKIQSIIIKTKDECEPLSEQIGVEKEQIMLYGEKEPFKGVILKRRGIIEKDFITLKLICTQETDALSIIAFDDDYQFTLRTSSACPILLQNPMIGFFDQFKWMFCIILWVVGIFLLGFGYQLAQLSSIIIAAIMGFGFTTVVLGEAALDYDSSGAALTMIVAAGVVVGFIYLQASVTRFFFLLFNFGFSVGVVISLIIQSVFFYLIDTDMMYFPLGTSIIVLGIILGLLGLRYNLQMGIISTSLVGAYCLIRPWGFILGGYPNELLLTKQTEYGFPIKQSNTVYVYNAIILIIGIGCVIYQRKQHQKRVAFDDQLSTDIKYYEMGKVQEEKEVKIILQQRQSKGSDQNVTVHFAKHLDNEPVQNVQRYSHLTGSDKND